MTRSSLDPIESLLAVATASFRDDGTLVRANAGFRWLIEPATSGEPGTVVSHCFLQPSFASLAAAVAGPKGEVFRGRLTIGDFDGRTFTLHGVVVRAQDELHLVAEHDIRELVQLNEVVVALNRDYAKAQHDLAQANVSLQQINATLARQKAELEATLDRVKRLEGFIAICSYCKKVRTEDEAWQQIEHYVSQHSDAVFSHGICPTCYAKQVQLLNEQLPAQP